MSRLIDMSGQRFGRLVVLGVDRSLGTDGRLRTRWRCRCDCGGETLAFGRHLRDGDTSSCGCLRRETTVAVHTTYGLSKHPLYRLWSSVLDRCRNPRNKSYPNYGERGIRVCDRWVGPEGFKNFLSDMGERPKGLTLDRIDNDGDYEPENCRWATMEEQQRNKRASIPESAFVKAFELWCEGKSSREISAATGISSVCWLVRGFEIGFEAGQQVPMVPWPTKKVEEPIVSWQARKANRA